MKAWYFNLAEFKVAVGSSYKFTGGPDDGTQYLHVYEVTEILLNKN